MTHILRRMELKKKMVVWSKNFYGRKYKSYITYSQSSITWTEVEEVLVPHMFRASTGPTHRTPLLKRRKFCCKEGSFAVTFGDIIEMGNKWLSYNLSYLNYRSRKIDQKAWTHQTLLSTKPRPSLSSLM